jgi:hypothetical protein
LLSNTKIAIQQRYLGETKLKVVVLLSRVERDKTLGEIAIPNFAKRSSSIVLVLGSPCSCCSHYLKRERPISCKIIPQTAAALIKILPIHYYHCTVSLGLIPPK